MKRQLGVSLLLASGIASADVSLVYPQQTACKSTMTSMQISGSRMRMDSVMDNKKYSMLFDGTEDMITMLDHSNRQYHQTEVDEDALDYNKDVMSSTGTYIDNQMKTVQAQMKQQCAQMEKQGLSCPNIDLTSIMQNAQAIMGQGASQKEIRTSDKTQTLAGMTCRTFERYENGIRSSEECYIEQKDIPMSDLDKKYLLRNMKVMLHYTDTFAGLSEKFKMSDTGKASLQDPANSNLLLLKTCFMPDGNEAGQVVVQVSNETINESSFDIPSGYQVMSMTGQ
ncbi:MAG: hypothetical protein ABI644_12870 [Arenimonas sp.]